MPAIAELIPDLGALVAAGFLLLIALALWVLAGVIRNTFARVPVIGPWVGANIVAALNDARNAVLDGAKASWGAAVAMFRWTLHIFEAIQRTEWNIVIAAWQFGSRVYDVTLPNLESRVLVDASGWFNSAEAYAKSLWDSATAYVNSVTTQALITASGWVTAAENRAVALFNSATAAIAQGIVTAETWAANAVANASTTLQADIHAAEVFAADGINALESNVQAAVNTLSGDIATGIATAESVAALNLGAAVGGIYTDLDTWGKQAIADAWPDAQGDIGALRNVLGGDFPWLNDLLGALGGLGAAGLLHSLISSQAGAQAITRLATDCIVPQCRNLGGLSNDLGNLLSDAAIAAMLAWLIFAVTDPSGWAGEMMTVAAPIATETSSAAARLFEGG